MAIDKINPAAAAGVYAQTAKTATGQPVEGGDSFGALVKKAALDAINTLRGGEKMSAQAVSGKAELTDVVQAMTAAELTLQTVVAVRDRLLQSYQELMRMPI